MARHVAERAALAQRNLGSLARHAECGGRGISSSEAAVMAQGVEAHQHNTHCRLTGTA